MDLLEWELRTCDVLAARLLLEEKTAVGRRQYELAEICSAEYFALLKIYGRLSPRRSGRSSRSGRPGGPRR